MAVFNGGPGPDSYTGTPDSDGINGNGGDDTLKGEGGSDSINGGADNDTIEGGPGTDQLIGGPGNDRIDGGTGDDNIRGDAGNDILTGGDGNDLMRGGPGVDSFEGGAEDPNSTTFSGASTGPFAFSGDRISFFEVTATQGVVADLATGVIANDGFGNVESLTSIEGLGGDTAFADTFNGNEGGNLLLGSRGDTLRGRGGDDAISISGAPALADGGDGNDYLGLTSAGYLLPDANGDGTAETRPNQTAGWTVNLQTGVVTDGFGDTGTVANIENVYGTDFADTIFGDGNANELSGFGGNDVLVGLGGNDRIEGGTGDDVVEGNEGNDTLIGGDGNDLLRGNAGVDSYDGGANDPSSTTFNAGPCGDRISFFDARATAGVVADLRNGTIANDGFGNAETMTAIESLGGATAFADTFDGNDARNFIIIDQGDTGRAHGGDDLFQLSSAPALADGGDGVDGVILSTGGGYLTPDANADGVAESRGAAANGWIVNLQSGAVTDGYGQTGTIANIEDVQGSGSRDVITGNSANNVLSGNGGNDELSGGAGNDTLDGGVGGDAMTGGLGDDIYVIDVTGAGGDVVIENPNEGTDEIRTAVDFSLGGLNAIIENLSATGTGNIFLGGSASANVITGNGGNNYLVGEGGNDTLNGGGNVLDGANSGRDIAAYRLPFGTTGTVRLVDGTGADAGKLLAQLVNGSTVETFLKVALTGQGAATVEGVGIGAFMGTDTVVNIEELHIFVDTQNGGAPVPSQFVIVALAPLQFGNFVGGSEGNDTIDLAAFPGALNANGNAGNDVITGTTADNQLGGGAGNDQLNGLAGNDRLIGDAGNDTIDGGTNTIDNRDIAIFQLPAGTTGSVRFVDGVGADAGKLLVQLVNGGDVQTWLRVTINGQGSATVEGVGIGAFLGTDTLLNVEEIHAFVRGADGAPVPPEQFVAFNLAPILFGTNVAGSEGPDTINLASFPGATSANGSRGDDSITGTDAANNLSGNAGNDTLIGLGGNDFFDAGDGNDIVSGGDGNDFVLGGSGSDTIDGGANAPDGVNSGRDTVSYRLPVGTPGSTRFIEGTGADAGTLLFQIGSGTSFQTFLRVTITGPGSATVEGVGIGAFLGTDTLTNIETIDAFVPNADSTPRSNISSFGLVPNRFGNTVNGSPGADAIDLANFPEAINANGNQGNDTITGTDANNVLSGGPGNDTILGLGGDDTLNGNDGSDVIEGGAGNDAINETQNGNDTLRGGAGSDVIFVQRQISAPVGSVTIEGDEGNDIVTLAIGNASTVTVTSGVGDDIVQLAGSPGSISVTLGAGRDAVALNNVITAPQQPPVITDFVAGDAGDRLVVSGFAAGFLTNFAPDANPFGTGHFRLVQDGADTLFQVDRDAGQAAFAFVTQLRLSGVTASALTTFNLGGYALDGSASPGLIIDGTAADEALFGNAGDDIVNGLDGADFVFGGAGDDQLNGGAGADRLFGETGSDILEGGEGDDFLQDVSGGGDLLNGGAGNDQLNVSRPLFGTPDQLTLNGGDGNDLLTINLGNGGTAFAAANGGAGNDIVRILSAGAGTTVSLGDGQDVLDFDSLFVPAGGFFLPITVTDFAPGATGDRIQFQAFLQRTLIGWNPATNPFTQGYLAIVPGADDTPFGFTLLIRPTLTQGFSVLATFENTPANRLTAFNFGGFVTNLGEPVFGTASSDTLTGTANSDSIIGLAGDDTISGLDGDDVLDGDAGNDNLIGGPGDDALIGGPGADRLEGGAGNDSFEIDDPGDTINEAAGMAGGAFDTVFLRTDSFTIPLGIEETTYIGSGFVTITGNVESNAIEAGEGSSGSLIDGGDGDDVIEGGFGSDTLRGGPGNDDLEGDDGDDILEGGDGNDDLEGDEGSDILRGGDGNDELVGDNGEDEGPDLLEGGAGNDSYYAGEGDTIVEAANGGVDTLIAFAPGGLLPDNVENYLQDFGPVQNVTGNALDNRLEGAGLLSGGDGNDVLIATASNGLVGGIGNDTLLARAAGAGANLFNGGPGDDYMAAGPGNDIYIVDSAGDQVVEFAGQGIDTVIGSLASYGLLDTLENYTFNGTGSSFAGGNDSANTIDVSAASSALVVGGGGNDIVTGGTGNDTLFGNGGNDTLTGQGGNDVLGGGAGVDTIDGGAGNDVLEGGDDADSLTGGEGDDTINGDLGNDILIGDDAAGLLSGNDVLSGGGGEDELLGGLGNDTLSGGDGNDRLNGGAGADYMVGGSGNDDYFVDSNSDAVVEQTDAGIDRLRVTDLASIGLTANVENVDFDFDGTNGFIGGNELGNIVDARLSTGALVVVTAAGNDFILSGSGNDNLNGGEGNDVVEGNDGDDYITDSSGVDSLIGGAGDDTLVAESGVEGGDRLFGNDGNDIIFAGAGGDTIEGGDGIDLIIASAGRDLIDGGAGDDTIDAGDGADQITGGDGADYLIGGAGDDDYFGVTQGDVIAEDAGGGYDRVVFNAPVFGIFDNIEEVTFAAPVGQATAVQVYGNAGHNVIDVAAALSGQVYAGDGADRITGSAGNDTLVGQAGDDTILGEAGSDYLSGGTGNDTLRGGSGTDSFEGGDGDDMIFGGADDDRAFGNGGADTLNGEGGNDILAAGAGNDTIDGGDGNDLMNGEDGFDRLFGGLGNDTLFSSLGGDELTGGLEADRFRFTNATTANGTKVLDFETGIDKLDFSLIDADPSSANDNAFVFIGSAAFNGTGINGQLRAEAVTGGTRVEGDLNGDGIADFTIFVQGDPIASGDLTL